MLHVDFSSYEVCVSCVCVVLCVCVCVCVCVYVCEEVEGCNVK